MGKQVCYDGSGLAQSAVDGFPDRRRFIAIAVSTIAVLALVLVTSSSQAAFGHGDVAVFGFAQLSAVSALLLLAISGVFLQRWFAGMPGGSFALALVVFLLAAASIDLVWALYQWTPGQFLGLGWSIASAARTTAVALLGLQLLLWRRSEASAGIVATVAAAIFAGSLALGALTDYVGRTPGGIELSGSAYATGLIQIWFLAVFGAISLFFGRTRLQTGQLWMGFLAVVIASSDLVIHNTNHPTHVDFVGGLTLLFLGSAIMAAGFHNDLAQLRAHDSIQLEVVRLDVETGRATLEAERYDRAVVSHDGQSALLAIEGGLRFIAKNPDVDPAATNEIYAALSAELARLRNILSGRELRSMHQFDVSLAVEPVVRLHETQHVAVMVHMAPSAHAYGDLEATREILQNLLDNAVCHGGGERISVRVVEYLETVSITVADAGPGVPASLHNAIFERGVTSKIDSATGLGSFSSRDLARKMGGALTIDPVAMGASFTVMLPTKATAPTSDEETVKSSSFMGEVVQLLPHKSA